MGGGRTRIDLSVKDPEVDESIRGLCRFVGRIRLIAW